MALLVELALDPRETVQLPVTRRPLDPNLVFAPSSPACHHSWLGGRSNGQTNKQHNVKNDESNMIGGQVPTPFVVSIAGSGQKHVNHFSRRLPSLGAAGGTLAEAMSRGDSRLQFHQTRMLSSTDLENHGLLINIQYMSLEIQLFSLKFCLVKLHTSH